MSQDKSFVIGKIALHGRFGLAPMAGVGDAAFRHICILQGAGYSVSEMVSAKALCYGDPKTCELLKLGEREHPCAVQIFGSEPEFMAKGAALALAQSGADIVDINMGCPAGKIIGGGDGAALMKSPELASEIIKAVKAAVDCPVTVKMRAGWNKNSVNAVEFARMCEEAGADAICIHGRTADMGYSGLADIELMAEVVATVNIPTMVNGDITSARKGAELLEKTGAPYALIGRGALGNPWIFRDCREYVFSGRVPTPVSLEERLETFVRQVSLAMENKGEVRACLEARTHFCHYLKGIKNAAKYRRTATSMRTLTDALELVKKILAENQA